MIDWLDSKLKWLVFGIMMMLSFAFLIIFWLAFEGIILFWPLLLTFLVAKLGWTVPAIIAGVISILNAPIMKKILVEFKKSQDEEGIHPLHDLFELTKSAFKDLSEGDKEIDKLL